LVAMRTLDINQAVAGAQHAAVTIATGTAWATRDFAHFARHGSRRRHLVPSQARTAAEAGVLPTESASVKSCVGSSPQLAHTTSTSYALNTSSSLMRGIPSSRA
jgi:hypothetical protein